MGFWEDMQGSLFGGASGAASGGMVGGWPGAIVGGGLGLAGGYLQSHGTSSAAGAQQAALDDAMKRLQQFNQQQQGQRMDDLNKTMAFYGPADAYLHSIYAQPPAPSTAPPAPPISPENVPRRARLPVPGGM